MARLLIALQRPLDAAGLAAFRACFGLLMAWSMVRFWMYGWIDELFVKPQFFFKYWGFEWVPVPSAPVLHALFGALFVLALCVAAGLFYRIAAALFLAGFAYVQLLDVTNYLNHYYLVCLIALLFAVMPLGRAYSLDAWRRPATRVETFPAWMTYLLRFQVAVVYVFAGLAKAGGDWLLHAQPLNLWLSARTEMPVLGPWLDEPAVAMAMSWAGFLFDTSIVGFLSWRRTRPLAYAVVVVFHAVTSQLFPIGMFPWIMVTAALIFFSPSWPRRFSRAPVASAAAPAPSAMRRPWMLVGAAYCALQVLVPLRHHVYGGDVLWHEQGMRFAWKVMVREKNASVTYVVEDETGRQWQVSPKTFLTDRQLHDFGTQPDLVLQLAHHIARVHEARGLRGVRVRAEARVSLNGRRAQLLVDPKVDLAQVKDGLAPARWVLPAPATPPARLVPLHG